MQGTDDREGLCLPPLQGHKTGHTGCTSLSLPYPSLLQSSMRPGPPPPAPPTSVGHAARFAELPDPIRPLPSPLARLSPRCSASTLPRASAWKAPSGSSEVSPPLAQLCGASAAATRPRPAAAKSQAAPGTTAERGECAARREGPRRPGPRPARPRVRQPDLQSPLASWLCQSVLEP